MRNRVLAGLVRRRRRRPRRRVTVRPIARGILAVGLLAAGGFLVLDVLFPFPVGKLCRPASPEVLDRRGRVLLRRAGPDGYWRLPVPLSRVSPWLLQATVAVEDRRFPAHPGFDLVAAVRALFQDVTAGRVVSGASTITMQLCRMLDPRPRTLAAKAVESFRALQLERILGKGRILEAYLNLAPYGGNILGAEAASRIWFGKSAADLSLPEAALLAGLPQSPSRYRPDRHPGAASARRATVLLRMEEEGMIDARTRAAAAAVPVRVRPLRGAIDEGKHGAWWALSLRPAGGRTTIDLDVQRLIERLVREQAASLPPGTDVAVVVMDTDTGEIRALVGSADPTDPADGQVNGALALRSPGSALKPFLYAAAFAAGRLAPDSSLPDRPVEISGWRPRNFSRRFEGRVTAAEALRRSLNVPAILLAERVGLERLAGVLRAAGIPLPADAARRGGLALVTGGVEVRLVDLVNGYATLARGGVFRPARILPGAAGPAVRVLPAAVCANVDDILSCRRRAAAGLETAAPGDVPWFMWKTGTSSGRRDAWAVGHNRHRAAGVWVGRFSGAGDVRYTGAEAAEPLLARILTHPLLRADVEPPPPPRLTARRPWFSERERIRVPLRILSPADGARFRVVEGTAVIHPESTAGPRTVWFLDGIRLPPEASRRLLLPPGRHVLRCVTPDGARAAVRLTVRR